LAHGDVQASGSRWSARDPSAYDHLPLIGRYTPFSSRVFLASGFMKWGLSSGTFAAMILRDLIAVRHTPWSRCFSPNRLSLRSAPELARMNARVGTALFLDRLA